MSVDAPDGVRRRLVLATSLGGLLLAAGGMLAAALRLALARGHRRRLIVVGRVGDFVPGTWRLVEPGPAYMVVSAAGVAAVSARCTHLGCTVQRQGDGFVCPCHGSRFDPLGRALTAPARAPLPWLHVEVVGDEVLLDPGREVAAGTYTPAGGAGV